MEREQPGAVLVLGASRGLGRAVALELAASGFPVGIGCRRGDDADHVAGEVEAAGGRALPLQVDVTCWAEVEAAAARLASRLGRLGGVVNNAGIIEPIGGIEDTDPAAWASLLAVNLTGAYHGVRAVLPRLREGGVVLNVSSGAAARPMEGWSAYCASKAGLAMLTRSVHHEHGGRGVRAYGFRPGLVDTGMQAEIRASRVGPVSRVPREELTQPQLPAAGIAWLFRHRPAELSGQEMDIRDPEFRKRMS